MSIRLIWIIVGLFFIIGCCVEKTATRGVRSVGREVVQKSIVLTREFGDYYALLIYVDDYTILSKLYTPKYDIEAMADILRSRYGFKDIKIVSNPKNSDDLVAVFDEYSKKMRSTDNLLIYYAGHGNFEERMQEGFWQLKDAKEDSRVGWIPVKSAINNTLNIINAKHILVMSDSCYSGAIIRKGGARLVSNRDEVRYYREIYKKKSRTALTSGGLEPVLDADPINPNNSIFVNALLYTLQNNEKSLFSLEEKFSDIKKYIKLKTEQTPQYSDITRTGHEMGGDFIFVDNSIASNSMQISNPTPLSTGKSISTTTRGEDNIRLGNRVRKSGDIERAKAYYTKACKSKNRFACAWLGWIYGTEHKEKKAITFLAKACAYGHKKSCEIIEEEL